MQARHWIIGQPANAGDDLVGNCKAILSAANIVQGPASGIVQDMHTLSVKSQRGRIDTVLGAEGIEMASSRRQKGCEQTLFTMSGSQDVYGSQCNWRVAYLGEIVQSFGDHLGRQSSNRHEDVAYSSHGSPFHQEARVWRVR